MVRLLTCNWEISRLLKSPEIFMWLKCFSEQLVHCVFSLINILVGENRSHQKGLQSRKFETLKYHQREKKKNSPLRIIHLPTSCQQQEANNRVHRTKSLTNNSATTLIPQGTHRHQTPFSPGSIFWLFWPPVSLPCNTTHHFKHPSWKYSN